MPRTTFAILIISVIALAAVTVWALTSMGGLTPYIMVIVLGLALALRVLATKR